MPDWIIAVILGIIEGITEFIPVSSTGHLLIAEHWLGHQSDLYNIVIQCGAVIAVIPLFHQRFHQFIFQWREKATQDYLLKICLAFFITGAIGFVLDKKGLKLPENLRPVAIAVLVGGIAFVAVEYWLRGKKLRDEITWTVAIAVGIGQLLAAVFPGTSRSGATIVLALLLGLNRPLATEFSFLVGIPTMLAAGGLKIFKALHHPPAGAPHENWRMILLCTVVSAIVSFIAVKWMLRYVQTHTFNLFGWYRIVLGIGLFLLLLAARPGASTMRMQPDNQRPQLTAAIARARE
ncbi:MAG TPA: undecaprenyl-diphosphate phosphatase [Verrucomicrobiae bacterium]|jgi:undecaprenyl-diphosphatase|nr:undecaprenyl-diphosphate phosphatase [Verrucomicrobiae bacterium]